MGVGEEENPLLLSGLEANTQRHQQVHLSSGVSSSTIKEIWLESKELWQIAGPSIFSRLAMFSMTVITQSFAGHLGDLNLASISIATTLIISISFGFLLGMASALETLCGRAYGAKQYHMLGIYMQRSWIVLFLCSIMLLPLFLFATPILKLIGQPADIAEQTAFTGLWEFFKLSLASGIMLLLENIYYRVLITVSGFVHNTKVAVDALSICVTILSWESMIPLGFLAATGVRVANELGAGNAKGAKFATIVSLLTSLVVGLLCWSIVIAFPEKLAMIFTSSSFVILMVNELAVLLAFTILLNCIQPVLSGVAIGSGWQALVAYINIGSYYIVGVPLGFLLGWLLHFGIKGLWAGMICGTVVQTLVLSVVTMKCEWEKEAEKAQIHITKEAAST
eukprot:XP_024456276.1 protein DETOXIFICATION 27 isoform X3 [Populus trichocarpa]